MIPYGRQEITEADIAAVLQVLRSDYLTQGPRVPEFETAIAAHCGAEHAVAVNSATSALHIACQALGVGHGHRVWTSPITFVASANCALYCGASVDFVDIDPRTYNMSIEALETKLRLAQAQNRLPAVVIPVHFAGQPCDMKSIRSLAEIYGFKIIEDASHAVGARYVTGELVGGCQYSDITVFSFHPVKIITTAEGGMALTNNLTLASVMARLRSHGITRDQAQMRGASEGPWYYQQIELGWNYRMTELQAALGHSQLQRLEKMIKKRHELARRYEDQLDDLPIDLPWQYPGVYSAYHLFVILIKLEEIQKSRLQIFEELLQEGIGVNVHYIPVYSQPYYSTMGFNPQDYPVSNSYYQRAISIPMYSSLTANSQSQVISALKKVLKV